MKLRRRQIGHFWPFVLVLSSCSTETDQLRAGQPGGQQYVVSNDVPGQTGQDFLIRALDAQGVQHWEERDLSPGDQHITSVAAVEGGVVLAGYSSRSLEPVDGTPPVRLRETQRAVFVRMMSADGKTLWTRQVALGDESVRPLVQVKPDRISVGVMASGFVAFGRSSIVARGESVKLGEISRAGKFEPTPVVDLAAKGTLAFAAAMPSCGHSPCTTGPNLNGFCDWCVGLICSRDPFCCNNNWDAQCVSEVATICGQRCDNRVCTTGQPFNAYATPCTGNVCSLDPFCCEQGWDSACVAAVPSRCGIQCP